MGKSLFYLSILIPTLLVEVGIVFVIFYCIFSIRTGHGRSVSDKNQDDSEENSNSEQPNSVLNSEENSMELELVDTPNLEDNRDQFIADSFILNTTYKTVFPNSRCATLLLAIYRLAAFLFFLLLGCCLNFIYFGSGLQYFTNWNLIAISLYYVCSFTISVVGLRFDNNPHIEWTKKVRLFGRFTHVLFEVLGATALVVTIVVFAFLDSHFEFWNMVRHFFTLISFLIEMSFNGMTVRLDHFLFHLTWAVIYLVIIWILRGTDIVAYPYYFMKTTTAACFAWYNGLLILFLVCYLIWFGLSNVKIYALNKYTLTKRGSIRVDNTAGGTVINVTALRKSSQDGSERSGSFRSQSIDFENSTLNPTFTI
jgi:hypothetical protein